MTMTIHGGGGRWWRAGVLTLALLGAGLGSSGWAQEKGAFPLPSHLDQATLPDKPFTSVFAAGDKLFNASFNSIDGAGANLTLDAAISVRFSRVPRADLPGFSMNPIRNTGPEAQSCRDCHNSPFAGAAGGLQTNGIRDSLRKGNPAQFVIRNPIHLFGSGALQKLAEQATADLQQITAQATAQARKLGTTVTVNLVTSNAVNYGTISVDPTGKLDTHGVQGMDADLVVKPYLWKGELASFLRALVRGSAELELGMEADELVGPGNDFDHDGVADELSVGDVTAMSVYAAALPRPVTKLELSRRFGGRYALQPQEAKAINNGEQLFTQIGCASCHKAQMILKDPVFREPSSNAAYRDATLLTGIDPRAFGLNPAQPVSFDLTANPSVGADLRGDCGDRGYGDVDSGLPGHSGHAPLCFPQFERDGHGGVVVRLYGDLKRHDMGPALAEPVDEIGSGASMWKTRDLWGVGSTGPWLHDGRATTLSEAILLHGGEGQQTKNAFAALSESQRAEVIAFLNNLVLYAPRHEAP
jgi:cytochrome c peroxidase